LRPYLNEVWAYSDYDEADVPQPEPRRTSVSRTGTGAYQVTVRDEVR
jgi:hypothetical protein